MTKRAPHNAQPVRHLYVHFPFCARICPYCAFYKTRGSSQDVERFCRALALEAECVAQDFPLALETIFFGGGTPTALSSMQLQKLSKTLHRVFDLSALREWSIEANPGSVSPKKAAILRQAGINRVSLGVQSWDDEMLRLLGREHNAQQAEQSYRTFRGAGFSNISIDLMFALPGQSETQWLSSLQRTIALGPEHISTYCLTFEEDTEFLARFQRSELRTEEEMEARFLETAMKALQAAGYEQYEISNHAKPGFRSMHNQAYWRGADYLGLGPSAFSTLGFARWQNVADHREYARRIFAGESAVATTEALTGSQKHMERIALGLRMEEGIPTSTVAQERSRDLVSAGLLAEGSTRFFLTRAGKLVADSVAEELL